MRAKQKREKEAAALAEAILGAAGLLTAPVDPWALAKSEAPRLEVIPANFGSAFDGRLEYHPSHRRFLLFVNTKYDEATPPGQHHPRTRFSLSHELGHFYLERHRVYLLGGGRAHGSVFGYDYDVAIEREADAFAAGLLLPETLLQRLDRRPPDARHIKELASHFQTSLVSTAIRCVNRSQFPCAVVGVQGGAIVWQFFSDALIEGGCYPSPKGPLRSATARKQWDAFAAGEEVKENAFAPPVAWFGGGCPKDAAFSVEEHYLPITSMNVLLVLLSVPEGELFPEEREDEDGE
jgi:hypothetical protein